MKRDSFTPALLLAALLVTGAFAQQNAPQQTSQTQSKQQDQEKGQVEQSLPQASEPEAAPAAEAPRERLQVETKEGFWGRLNPFARKKYVQRQLNPIAGRVNELDELTAANSNTIKDLDARTQEGIRTASLKVNEADTHAAEAGKHADLAHQTAIQATERLQGVEQTVSKIDQYQPVTQMEIRFRPGHNVLNNKAKAALDELAAPLREQKGYVVEVQGFSSGRGQEAVQNSRRMADAVVRYLVLEHQVPVYRIFTVGMGNAPAKTSTETGAARPSRGGRVEISLLHNSLAEMGQNTMPATPPPVQ